MGGVSMTLVEKMIATAFFKGYSLSFDYTKYYDYDNATTERRRLMLISDINYNDDDILICGCIDDEFLSYRKFFLDNHCPHLLNNVDHFCLRVKQNHVCGGKLIVSHLGL